jgi:hypothetical protein
MKRAIAACCFAAAFYPCLARADDDGASSLPPLPAPEAPPAPAPAPVTTASAEDTPPGNSAADEPARTHRLVWSLEGAFAHQQLYFVPINSAEVALTVGANFPGFSISGLLSGTFGATVDGLHTVTANWGPLFEVHAGVFRLGAGARVGVLYIPRATDGAALGSTSIGVIGRVTADVLGADSDEGLFLVAKATVDYVGTALYGVTIGLGVRWLRF